MQQAGCMGPYFLLCQPVTDCCCWGGSRMGSFGLHCCSWSVHTVTQYNSYSQSAAGSVKGDRYLWFVEEIYRCIIVHVWGVPLWWVQEQSSTTPDVPCWEVGWKWLHPARHLHSVWTPEYAQIIITLLTPPQLGAMVSQQMVTFALTRDTRR